MNCPLCGLPNGRRLTIVEGLIEQGWKVISAVAFVGVAIVGQSDLIGEPWKHYVTVASTIAGLLVAWNIKQHPVVKDESHV